MPEIIVKVSQGIDDGYRVLERNLTTGLLSYSITRYGVCYDCGKTYSAWRDSQSYADCWFLFRGVNIPKGTIITDARLILACSSAESGVTVNTKIVAESIDNADRPIEGDYQAGWEDYESRPKTEAAVQWLDLPRWYTEERYTSPNIASVIQEIINRDGWVEGNNIQIFWMDDGSTEGVEKARRSCCGYEYPLEPGEGLFAAELHITYGEVIEHLLSIESSPISGVQVTVDGVDAGLTPTSLTVIEGEHQVSIQEEVIV